jgi:transposase
MGRNRSDEFRKDAVRIALTSGLTCRQFADDLGIGMSTLNKWITAHRDTDVVSADDRALARENEQLRREIRILKEERDILNKATQFFASQKLEVQVHLDTQCHIFHQPLVRAAHAAIDDTAPGHDLAIMGIDDKGDPDDVPVPAGELEAVTAPA